MRQNFILSTEELSIHSWWNNFGESSCRISLNPKIMVKGYLFHKFLGYRREILGNFKNYLLDTSSQIVLKSFCNRLDTWMGLGNV